jgi:type VI secretion system secreted protein Hcp
LISRVRPGIEPGNILTENVRLKFSTIPWQYVQQKIGGGISGSTAGGWNRFSNKIA